MKKQLRKLLFKNCYIDCDLLNCGLDINRQYENEIFKYKMKLRTFDEMKKLNDNDQKILSFFNHNGREAVATVSFDSRTRKLNKFSLSFYIYFIDCIPFKIVQTLYTEVYIQEDNQYHIYIVDFIGKINQGYGSILMQQFLDYIKQMPVTLVHGYLSEVDLNRSEKHKELLFHFYKKFGFTITENYKIYLKL